MCRKSQQKVQAMSAIATKNRIDKMILAFLRTSNDQEHAVRTIAERTGHGYWTIENIRNGRTKRVFSDVRDTILSVYLDVCAEQARRWKEELKTERAKGTDDAALRHLEREVENISAQIDQRRQALGGGK